VTQDVKLSVTFVPQTVSVGIDSATMGIRFGDPIARDLVERDPYTGEYTITPGDETVVLSTSGLRMTDNVTINPVPSNYGRITYNGSVITVS
jgi:hypothetical protein